MKKLTTLLSLLLIIAVAGIAQDTWQRITPLPQENTLYQVAKVPGTNRIVAAGDNSTLMISEDLGDTWELINNPADLGDDAVINTIEFVNENIGFLGCNYEKILKTTDGGYTWEKVFQGQNNISRVIPDIEFLNPMVGYTETFYNGLTVTYDGGETWSSVGVDWEWPQDIEFANEEFGLVIDAQSVHNTIDGGSTWQEYIFPDSVYFHALSGLWILNDSSALLNGSSMNQNVVYRTEDYGNTWYQVLHDTNSNLFGDMLFFDENFGFFHSANYYYGEESVFFMTEDGGKTWAEQPPMHSIFRHWGQTSFAALDENSVIFVGSFGNINFSHDKGYTWTVDSTRCIYGDFKGAWFFDDQKTLALCAGSDYSYEHPLVFSENVESWEAVNQLQFEALSADFLSPDTGFVIHAEWYDDNLIEMTTDGGDTWQNYLLGYDYTEKKIDFYDYNHGIIICDRHLLKTENAGLSWVEVTPEPRFPCTTEDICYVNDQKIVITGNCVLPTKNVWISTDGGTLWENYDFDIHYPKEIFFLNDTLGYIAGDEEIAVSIDGGYTWTYYEYNLEGEFEIRDLIFINPLVGYAIGAGDFKMIKTTDGGVTWNIIPLNCTSGLSVIHFYDEVHGVVFGDNGLILYTEDGGPYAIDELEPLAETSISVFPNPATNILNITFNDPQQDGALIIRNAAGAEVMRRDHHKNVNGMILSINNLESGIYLVQYLVNGKTIESKKIIVQ